MRKRTPEQHEKRTVLAAARSVSALTKLLPLLKQSSGGVVTVEALAVCVSIEQTRRLLELLVCDAGKL